MKKGGKEAVHAAEAIGKLPQDKLPVDAVISCFDSLKTHLDKEGYEARCAAGAIGKLPLDKLPVDAVISCFYSLKTLLDKGGIKK